jgi:integrase
MFVWLAMVTGARRGELCALAWDRLDFAAGVLTIRSSIAQRGAKTWEKETKTHQQRRITLDDQTLGLLRAYLRRCNERAAALGFELPPDARMFSLDLDGSSWLKPDSVSQRYAKMCARLGWDMNIHQLRHYSATELIASGVDVRTVAGRLGTVVAVQRRCASTARGCPRLISERRGRWLGACRRSRLASPRTAR